MNLRLCVQALLLLWLSLTAVYGGECAPSRSPALPFALPGYSRRAPLPPPHSRSLGLPESPARAMQEQPRAGCAERQIDRASTARGSGRGDRFLGGEGSEWPRASPIWSLVPSDCPSQSREAQGPRRAPRVPYPAPHVVGA